TPGVCVSRGFSADGCESSRLGLLLVPLLILGPHQGVVGDGHQQKVDLVIQRLEGAGSPTQPQEVLHSLEVRLGVLADCQRRAGDFRLSDGKGPQVRRQAEWPTMVEAWDLAGQTPREVVVSATAAVQPHVDL